jgi:hypothetical protein
MYRIAQYLGTYCYHCLDIIPIRFRTATYCFLLAMYCYRCVFCSLAVFAWTLLWLEHFEAWGVLRFGTFCSWTFCLGIYCLGPFCLGTVRLVGEPAQ